MTREFCTYTQSLALKELGFEEPCFGLWDIEKVYYGGLYLKSDGVRFNTNTGWKNTHYPKNVTAPLYQQCFKWFREKYSLFHNIWNYTHGEPTDLVPNGFTYSIDEDWITIIGKKENGYFEKYYETYEEAESACLNKLIEIIKNK